MSQVDEIKERLNIVDVVSGYMKLSKAGRNYKGLSPFTKEKTPSFYVSPDKGMYYCFSSNKGGDIFTFIEEMEGVEFSGALKILAERAGVKLRHEDPKKRDQKDHLYGLLEDAARFYQKNFVTNKKAFRYMLDRGIKTEILKEFRVGFALDSWDGVLSELKHGGSQEEEIEKAGLVIKREERDGYYDRFRSRIMFPIMDTAGRVVGFTGRVFADESNAEVADTTEQSVTKAGQAKYVNTPETDLYHKSRILYGFEKAKNAIREKDACILVEGQMDVLASHQAGIKNVVAVSGTSLTVEHLKLILHLTKNIFIALDADLAGQRASDRSAKMALSLGMNPFALSIVGGKDPADLVQEDVALWKNAVEKVSDYIDFRIHSITEETAEDDQDIMIRETIFPHIFAMYGGIKKDRAFQKIAKATGASLEGVREDYAEWVKSYRPEENTISSGQEREKSASSGTETHLPFRSSTRKDVLHRRVLGVIFWQESLDNPTINIEKFRSGYFALAPDTDVSMIEQLVTEERKKLSFEAEILYGTSVHVEREVQELLRFLEIEFINEKLERVLRSLRKAERNEESEQMTNVLLKEYQDLSGKKEKLKRDMPQ